jgi:demethylmenaquinone methyltransferase/2-methoxy-6-polyprenyl-1,4-benzoquinol methylase
MPEARAIKEMFSGIAPRYDLANHVLSFGQDFGWRRRLVEAVVAAQPKTVVDLCTGSGDVAFALKKRLGPAVEVRGLDFCAPMLAMARQKQAEHPWADKIIFAAGDCLNLPLADNSVDALTIAWGLRNLEDRARGLREMHRTLRPGGRLFVLDNSQPEGWTKPFCRFYMNIVLPPLGGLLTGRPRAYRYLATSSAGFPGRAALAEEMAAAGFGQVRQEALAFGSVALHEAVK